MKKEIKQGMSELMSIIPAIRVFGVIKFIFYVVSFGWFFLVNLAGHKNLIVKMPRIIIMVLLLMRIIMVLIFNYYIKKHTTIKKLQREILILVIYIFEIILSFFSFGYLYKDYCIQNLNIGPLIADTIAIFILAHYLRNYTEIEESQRKNLIVAACGLKAILWFLYIGYSCI